MNDAMQAPERRQPQASELLQPGDTLGRYQLLCPIARGGMGQVWAARQTGRLGLPKLVAIKTAIPMDSKDYRQVQEYLFDEAQVASSVDHPNVCKILELGQERDVLFIAMEWLNGVPLSTLVSKLPQRRLAYRMAAYVVAQACSGLHAAHELTDDDGTHLEVVHRDATPHNLMITSTGEVKVMDFGIVKSKNQQHQATQTGELKGKLAYLAPEQIRGRSVDRRVDIFTLGCVLYQISVGKGAFNPNIDQDAGQTISRILEGTYSPPSSILPDYPDELEAVVQRALAKDPDQRFRTADEMRIALDAFLADGTRSVSREDVAALLHDCCGQSVEQRRSEIRSAQRLFDSVSNPMRSGAYPAADRVSDIAHPWQNTAELQSGASRISPLPLAPTKKTSNARSMLIWSGLGGIVLVSASLGALAFGHAPTEDENAGAAAASVSSPGPANTPPITANPPQPQGLVRGSTPVEQSQGRESATAELARQTDGVPSASQRVTATRSAARVNPARTASKAAQPSAAASASAADAAPTSSPSSTQFSQTLSRKPRHAIDESDPFGK